MGVHIEGAILRVKKGQCRICLEMSVSWHTQSSSAEGRTSMVWMPIGVYYMGSTLAPGGEYDWTVHVWRRCNLMLNYFDQFVICDHDKTCLWNVLLFVMSDAEPCCLHRFIVLQWRGFCRKHVMCVCVHVGLWFCQRVHVCRSAGYIELLVSKIGVTPPNLSAEQLQSQAVRWTVNLVSLSAYLLNMVLNCLSGLKVICNDFFGC